MKPKTRKETCPTCGKGTLSLQLVDLDFRVRGSSVTVHDIVVRACDACDEEVTDGLEIERAQGIARMIAARRRATG